ncbi:MAG: NADH-quinone oxidoreductase subunit J [Candidatus Aminicenantes bacterium]|nr:NADH-quinone oxidoreductase subunit J [Candidatus Aminicenantes bacterium]NIM83050.1 NADH-quinone oxidoreductase subunit J [Candidatus Aminicenantes bacterium]NIN19578.1 NADH-quinone oxidoreductase subunit J [Candidatus Aminicenantes bacterium]NIN40740.1 NADH-quinone oxidoreductase subunit J [Candidatus Aminicenantes bacterium]NIN83549.1 NADH-quinone oxidoreductase subunit J [Candidatus Aminicenantes bacterium]
MTFLDFILGHYAYWFTMALLAIGLYAMMMKKNLVKKLIGMTIFQVAVIIFYISSSVKWGGTVPILESADIEKVHEGVVQSISTAHYINPLPHTLMLTAIVVGVATTGVAFALVISIYKRYKTLNESELLERMNKENDNDSDN